jgi:hypothetical protein
LLRDEETDGDFGCGSTTSLAGAHTQRETTDGLAVHGRQPTGEGGGHDTWQGRTSMRLGACAALGRHGLDAEVTGRHTERRSRSGAPGVLAGATSRRSVESNPFSPVCTRISPKN